MLELCYSIKELNEMIPLYRPDEIQIIDEIRKMNVKVSQYQDTDNVPKACDIWEFYQKMISALYIANSGCSINELDPDVNQLSYYLCQYTLNSDEEDALETVKFVSETFENMEFASLACN